MYATARGVPASSEVIQTELGVKKSRAATIKEACMNAVEKFFQDKEVETGDIGFARVMISVCESVSGEEVGDA